MLAEIFMLRMEAIARAAKEAANSRFVPIALPAPKAPEGIVFAAGPAASQLAFKTEAKAQPSNVGAKRPRGKLSAT